MSDAPRMHADEVAIDADLVRRLLRAQLPHWADLPIERVASSGTDNAIHRLGDALAVRMPRIAWAAPQVEKEARWLPTLAPQLPLAIPAPLATGAPGEGYPWRWSVCPWIEGEAATQGRIRDPREAARDLGGFVAALRRIDATGGPRPGRHNFFRGVPLARRDPHTRAALAKLAGEIDVGAATAAWEAALAAPAWDGPPVWVHGDLAQGNVIVAKGRVRAVIDWGGLGVGDPAVDAIAAWTFFPPEARGAFREALGVDDATWARARGWALSVSLVALPYYLHTNPALVAQSRRAIAAVLAEAEEESR